MLEDILAALPAVTAGMTGRPGEWTLLGTVDRPDEAGELRHRLGNRFEVLATPGPTGRGGAHPWIAPRAGWEVWARVVASPS